MALRIGDGMPQEEAISEPAVMPEEMDAPIEELPAEPTGLVSPEAARYFGPESRCASCIHFMEGMEGGACEIVSGPIDPAGVCVLFTADAPEEMMLDEMPEAMAPEMAVEDEPLIES